MNFKVRFWTEIGLSYESEVYGKIKKNKENRLSVKPKIVSHTPFKYL